MSKALLILALIFPLASALPLILTVLSTASITMATSMRQVQGLKF